MWVGPQEHLDIIDKTFKISAKEGVNSQGLKEHFWGQKHTFKKKKAGSRANGSKVGIHIAIQNTKISLT